MQPLENVVRQAIFFLTQTTAVLMGASFYFDKNSTAGLLIMLFIASIVNYTELNTRQP